MADKVNLKQVINEEFVLESTSFKQHRPRLPEYGRLIIDTDDGDGNLLLNLGSPHKPDWRSVFGSVEQAAQASSTVNIDIASEVISEIIPGTNLSWHPTIDNRLDVERDLIYYSNDNTQYIRLSEGDSRYFQLAGKTGGQYARGGLDTTDTLKFAATAGIGVNGANIEFLYGDDGNSRAAYFDYQGKFNMDVLPHAATDTDKFVVGDGTLISYRTGTEVISDLDLANLYTSRALVNGAFQETFDCLATSDGATITATLEQAGGGDLTMQFSDGNLVLDCTPADSVTLTPGTDTSPEENWVYIPLSTKTLTANTTGWPSEEHIPVSYFYLKSATHVQSRGAIINQNWNDHLSGTNGQGHMSHIGMWIRSMGANWFDGCDGAGADGWVTIVSGSPDNIYIKVGSGVISQMHRHTYVAKDTSATDYLNIPNHPTDPWHETQDLGTVLVDSTGASLSGKYYNVVIGGVANKTGEFSPLMAKLPSGSYSNLTDAVNDIDNYTSFEMPRQFNKESSTGFLIALLTFKHSPAGGGSFTLENSVSLRGTSGATGAAGTGTTLFEFPDNQFKVYDNLDITRVLQFSLDSVTTGNTRTLTVPDGSGTIPLIEGLVGGQKLRGGSAVTDTLQFVATSGIGAAGANIEFLYGTDGDNRAAYFDYLGNLYVEDHDINDVNAIQFDLTPTHVHSEGSIWWSADDKTINIDTEVTDTVIQVGQETVIRCTNKTGVLIPDGTAVFVNGAQGQRPTIAPALATARVTMDTLIGLTTADFAINGTSYVTILGQVRGLDTSAFSEADILYVSCTVAGELVNVRPPAPNIIGAIGMVLYSHATEGIVGVKPTLFATIDQLSEVYTPTSKIDGAGLFWNDLLGYYEHRLITDEDLAVPLFSLGDDDHINALYPLNIASLYIEPDSGVVPIVNQDVTSDSEFGKEIGFKQVVGGQTLIESKATADGAGAITDKKTIIHGDLHLRDKDDDTKEVVFDLSSVTTGNSRILTAPDASGRISLSYRHTQAISSDTWTINHNLNSFPSITVKDSAGTVVEGQYDFTNLNTVTLTFNAAFTGVAELN